MQEVYGLALLLEDGCPGYKKYANQWRIRNNIHVTGHSPNSPDLNWGEDQWAELKRRLSISFQCPIELVRWRSFVIASGMIYAMLSAR
jgi:hypothetical protein